MAIDHPSDRIEGVPALEPIGDTGPGDGADSAPAAPFEFDPAMASQFAEIGEDYGREGVRRAMRRGLTGPVALCGASVLCFFIFRLLIPEGILYVLSIISLVRVWQTVSDTTVLDEPEKKRWKRRMWLMAAFLVLTGLLYAVWLLALLLHAAFVLTPDPGR